MAYHKGRGVAFGGVLDVEESEEGIDSEFFKELYIWNVDRNRIFPLALRRPKSGNTKRAPAAANRRDRGKADEEELLRNLAALETKGSLAGAEDISMHDHENGLPQDEKQESRREYPIRFEMPHERFNALLTVQDDTLYIYGGTLEKGDVEITFSDLYSIDLGKLDGVKELYYIEPANWNATIAESEDEDEDGEDDDDYDDDDDEDANMSGSDNMSIDTPPSTAPTDTSIHDRAQKLREQEAMMMEEEKETKPEEDPRPMPRTFETLRDFFARTSQEWQNLLLEKMKYGGSSRSVSQQQLEDQTVKELRKKAFEQAEERWWDVRPEVQALEDEQEAAGIGDVVSLADREVSGTGRRR